MSPEILFTMPLISGVVRWLKAEKRSTAGWPTHQLIDVLRRHLDLDGQLVRLRHDQHRRLARA